MLLPVKLGIVVFALFAEIVRLLEKMPELHKASYKSFAGCPFVIYPKKQYDLLLGLKILDTFISLFGISESIVLNELNRTYAVL